MKIVIVGYGEMFDSLVAGVKASGHEISGVFRHENILYNPIQRILTDFIMPSANRVFSKALGLYDIHARSVNSEKFRKEIKKLDADLIIVGSWSEKLSEQTINSPKIACINVHPSLLPKYRGPNPYTQTILNNEEKTGITFHLMDVNYDTGAILHQAKTSISKEETGLSLKLKCCDLARREIVTLLTVFDNKMQNKTPQNEAEATYFHHVNLKNTILDFENETSEEITRKIRAFTPWLDCHIPYKDEFFTFKTYSLINTRQNQEPATIINKTDDSLSIVCKDNVAIKFSGIKVKRPFFRLFNKLYLKQFVQINSKAL